MRPAEETSCDLCGLPLRRESSRRDGRRYCCYGCFLVDGITRRPGEDGRQESQAAWILTRVLLGAFLSMGVMVFSIVLYAGAWFPPEAEGTHPLGPLAGVFRWFATAFATPAVLLLGVPLLRQSVPGLSPGATPSAVNVLVTLGAFSAYALSLTNLLRGEGELYLETAVMLLLLVTVGRWLEAGARARAGASLRGLLSLVPPTARKLTAEDAGVDVVPVETLRRGDSVRVLAGERIPVDGEILRGAGCVDVSLITGESDAKSTEAGEKVYGGTLLADGVLDVRVSSEAGARLIDRMAAFVAEARRRRPRLEQITETASRWFLPLVLAVAGITFLSWWSLEGWFRGVLSSLAVLLIACPCSLGIAAPLAFSVALGRAARRGILVRGGEVLEALSRPGTVFFDKTGTLTLPQPELAEVLPAGATPPAEVLDVATSLASLSTHPLSRALAGARANGGAVTLSSGRVENLPGLGVLAGRGADRLLMGNRRLLSRERVDGVEDLLARRRNGARSDETDLFVVRGDALLGALSFRDRLRPEAREVVADVQDSGWKVRVLTGDTARRGRALEAALGVPVDAELLPEGKVGVLERESVPGTTTVMVGDGLNDAPVLAASCVGIALATAADLTRDTADVVLLDAPGRKVLEALPALLRLSRRTVTRVRWNLVWSFGYNSVGVTLASLGFVHPILAALLMILSSLSVVATSIAGQSLEPGRAG